MPRSTKLKDLGLPQAGVHKDLACQFCEGAPTYIRSDRYSAHIAKSHPTIEGVITDCSEHFQRVDNILIKTVDKGNITHYPYGFCFQCNKHIKNKDLELSFFSDHLCKDAIVKAPVVAEVKEKKVKKPFLDRIRMKPKFHTLFNDSDYEDEDIEKIIEDAVISGIEADKAESALRQDIYNRQQEIDVKDDIIYQLRKEITEMEGSLAACCVHRDREIKYRAQEKEQRLTAEEKNDALEIRIADLIAENKRLEKHLYGEDDESNTETIVHL
jgi:hypothetical protein